jgi:2-oxoglutarate ferredoxin oxidoreductase subunit alpha
MSWILPKKTRTKKMREYTDGATAVVRGALDAGCDFFAGYPISPATSILIQMLRDLPAVGGVAVQAEDEIAGISMCIGAAMAGARAMTATSGPGLSLYSESIGLAVMGEVPLVIVDVQRAGPATGGATTVGQGDIQFVRWGASGGYPIIALCPSSVPECYTLTMRAFDLAERFRCPAFLMTDKELNLTTTTVDMNEFVAMPVRERSEDQETGGQGEDEFQPYRFNPPDAVPPLARFGGSYVTRFTGSSHDEHGLLIKDPAVVGALNQHLFEKVEAHRKEIELVKTDLQPGAKTLVISYGITARAVEEAEQEARRKLQGISTLTIQTLWPVPENAIRSALDGVERIIVAELNLGEYRREIERIAGGRRVVGLNRVDGELISPEQILSAIAGPLDSFHSSLHSKMIPL